jgi:transposase
MSIKGRGKQMRNYEPEFKQKIVRLHLEEGRTIKSLSEEYEVSKASISIWVSNCSQECLTNQQTKEEYDYMMENRKLRKQLEEMEKENRFLKKASAFFAKEID